MEVQQQITSIAQLITVALVCGILLVRLRQPAIVGYMIAGVVLGPSGLALVTDRETIGLLAEMGVLLLLFVVGMELSLRAFLTVYRIAILGALAQVIICLGAMGLLMMVFGWPFELAVLLGFVISLSSTAVAIRMLEDIGELRTDVGRRTVGVLIAQDLLVVPMMLVLNGMVRPGGLAMPTLYTIGFALAFLAVFVWYLSRRQRVSVPLARWTVQSVDLTALSALAYCFAAATVTSMLGLSAALGAFLAGLFIGNSTNRREMIQASKPIQGVLLMVFFLSVGLLIDLAYIWENAIAVLLLLLIVTLGKTTMNICVLRVLGEPWDRAILTGLALGQVGEFSFVLAAIGLNIGLISGSGHQLVVAIIALSLIFSPFWLHGVRRVSSAMSTGTANLREFLGVVFHRQAASAAAPSAESAEDMSVEKRPRRGILAGIPWLGRKHLADGATEGEETPGDRGPAPQEVEVPVAAPPKAKKPKPSAKATERKDLPAQREKPERVAEKEDAPAVAAPTKKKKTPAAAAPDKQPPENDAGDVAPIPDAAAARAAEALPAPKSEPGKPKKSAQKSKGKIEDAAQPSESPVVVPEEDVEKKKVESPKSDADAAPTDTGESGLEKAEAADIQDVKIAEISEIEKSDSVGEEVEASDGGAQAGPPTDSSAPRVGKLIEVLAADSSDETDKETRAKMEASPEVEAEPPVKADFTPADSPASTSHSESQDGLANAAASESEKAADGKEEVDELRAEAPKAAVLEYAATGGEETSNAPPEKSSGIGGITSSVERYAKRLGKVRLAGLNPFSKPDGDDAPADAGDKVDTAESAPKESQTVDSAAKKGGFVDVSRLSALNPFARRGTHGAEDSVEASGDEDQTAPPSEVEDTPELAANEGKKSGGMFSVARLAALNPFGGRETPPAESADESVAEMEDSVVIGDQEAEKESGGLFDVSRLTALNPFGGRKGSAGEAAGDGEEDSEDSQASAEGGLPKPDSKGLFDVSRLTALNPFGGRGARPAEEGDESAAETEDSPTSAGDDGAKKGSGGLFDVSRLAALNPFAGSREDAPAAEADGQDEAMPGVDESQFEDAKVAPEKSAGSMFSVSRLAALNPFARTDAPPNEESEFDNTSTPPKAENGNEDLAPSSKDKNEGT